eukprot:1219446-Prymnesium_polylepis.1
MSLGCGYPVMLMRSHTIALRGPRVVCGGATRAVNMCRPWVTRAAAAAQRSLGMYKRPPECLIHRREGP